MTQKEIFYASGNPQKLKKASTFFKEHLPGLTLHGHSFNFAELQTHDLAAIAQKKALTAWHQLKKPVLADDAGIYFDAYTNFPSYMTKDIWHSLGLNMFKLLDTNAGATMKLFLTYCNGPDQMQSFVGSVHGTLVYPTDPDSIDPHKPYIYLLVPDGFDKPCVAYEGSPEEITTSFRAHALYQFAQWFKEQS